MTQTKMYKYIGRNGIITSPVRLDGINFIPMVLLKADTGRILTNGLIKRTDVIIEEEEVNEWREITANNDK